MVKLNYISSMRKDCSMGQIEIVLHRIKNLTYAFSRFPLSASFLVAVVIINAIDISTNNNYTKFLITLGIGAILGAVAQVIYERFFIRSSTRFLLMAIAILLTYGYYRMIKPISVISIEIELKTVVTLFALFIAFVWLPVIKGRNEAKLNFNDSFMVSFKGFFIAAFFSCILFGGISLIFGTVNQLLVEVDTRVYFHTANLVFLLFAPMFFLSLIPVYFGARDQKEDPVSIKQKEYNLSKLTNCPKYLEILISYIIIPLIAIFTVILLIYILMNINSRFWSNNLLEPMIVIYSVSVIVIYILASSLSNKSAVLFRRIIPKVLVPIVLFQTISSMTKIIDVGITHNRYYIILYGIFAVVSGILFCFLPVQKNGIIAGILIAFSVISIVPPVDAFTISRVSQVNLLNTVLVKNNMIENGAIKANEDITTEDKQKITYSMEYLNTIRYLNKVKGLPKDFDYFIDFENTFGFSQYDVPSGKNQFVYLSLAQDTPVPITGYDFFISSNIVLSQDSNENQAISHFEKNGSNYTLYKISDENNGQFVMKDANNTEMIHISVNDIFDRYMSFTSDKGLITAEEATFTNENDIASIRIVVQNLNMDMTLGQQYYSAEIYLYIMIK